MPVKPCQDNGKPGYQWGDSGKCYLYTPGDEASRHHAEQQAAAQGYAAGDHGAYDTLAAGSSSAKNIEVCVEGGKPGYRATGGTCHTYENAHDGTGRARARREAQMDSERPNAPDYDYAQSVGADAEHQGELAGVGRSGERAMRKDAQDMSCGAARDLPIVTEGSWDGAAAKESVFRWAGWPDNPQPDKAKKAFLAYDPDQGHLKGAYHLPFALARDGSLRASSAGIRAAASRLPQTQGLSDAVRRQAQAVIHYYEGRMHHSEPDADEHGGPSDNDADDKMPGEEGGSADTTQHGAGLPRTKDYVGGILSSDPPSADDMTLINSHALEQVDESRIRIIPMMLANTHLDRSFEKFPKAYLDRFAQTLPGKSMMVGHDYSQAPTGRYFRAEVRPEPDGHHHLYVKAYIRSSHPMAEDVRLGIAKDVSIGFNPDMRECDLCGKDYDGWTHWHGDTKDAEDGDGPCMHIAGQSYDGQMCTLTYGGDISKVEALEGSFVWLGCQRGAQATMSADKRAWAKSFKRKGDDMDQKEMAALTARVRELEAENERLKALADDGKSYREWQKAEILRLHSSLGEEATGKALVTALDGADVKTLDALRTQVDDRHAKAFAQGSGVVGGFDKATESNPKPLMSRDEYLFGVRRAG